MPSPAPQPEMGDDSTPTDAIVVGTPPNHWIFRPSSGLLDLTRPVALLAVAVLHFIPDDVAAVLARYRAALPPGSIQAISHGSDDHDDPALEAALRAIRDGYRGSATEVTLRSRDQLRELFTGTTLTPPGLVDVTAWPTPNSTEQPTGAYAALATIP